MSSPSPSFSFSSPTFTSTPTSTNPGSIGGGAPATATLLFGFLVIFAALLSAFTFLIFFWKVQQRRRAAFGPDIGEFGGAPGGVPKLWEVWTRDELPPSENQWNWERISPLSIDVDRDVSSGQTMSPSSRSCRPWPYRIFRRRPPPPLPPPSQAQQQQIDDIHGAGAGAGAGAEATTIGLVSGLRASFVIAMPHADAADRRRSEISQVSQSSWGRREYAIGTYRPSFREEWTL